jgi:hypothetical protein
MRIQKKNMDIAAGLLILAGMSLSGCKKELDVNTNPNVPTVNQGGAALIFPVGVLATVAEAGGDLEIVGAMWSEFTTQASLATQYSDIETYDVPVTDRFVTFPWATLYTSGLTNYQFASDQAKAVGDWNFYLMATVMKAYTAELLVDCFDQIPYTEALQGAKNLHPKFDDGYSIYTTLLKEIDTALGKDFTAGTNTLPGKQDLVFGGNMDNWIAFANTLKLKMYLRMINAHSDVATAGITALVNSGVPFLNVDASVTNFTDAPGLDNPLYEEDKRQLNSATNIRASVTFTSWLTANSDPRAIYYFQIANPVGINQGDFAANTAAYKNAAIFRNIDHTAATDPVVFISAAESYFMQAEADFRYFGGSNTKSLYDQGVTAAFAQIGDDASSFIAPGGAYAWGSEKEGGVALSPIAQIIRQKWASCAFGCHAIESYFEKNRTGFPTTSPVYSTDPSYIPGQWVEVKNPVLGAGKRPLRLLFPFNETIVNPNAPAVVPSTTAVWWGLPE